MVLPVLSHVQSTNENIDLCEDNLDQLETINIWHLALDGQKGLKSIAGRLPLLVLDTTKGIWREAINNNAKKITLGPFLSDTTRM